MPRPQSPPTLPSRAPLEPAADLSLECPECGSEILVTGADQVEGHAVHCSHCAADPELTREFDDATGSSHWILVDPMGDYDDAP